MSLHKLTVGAGYDYLTRQLAALDATEKGHTGLASYYIQRGESPGVWIGSGLDGIDGCGLHPLAELRQQQLEGPDLTLRDFQHVTRLGVLFKIVDNDSIPFQVEVAEMGIDTRKPMGKAWRTWSSLGRCYARTEDKISLLRGSGSQSARPVPSQREESTCRARGRYRRNVPPTSGSVTGAAVLVHGLWGNPHDWRWVRGLLEEANVQVITPDLPSHRTPKAGLTEDADEVRRAIRASDPPVAAVGWSYGGSVISLAAAGEESVSHLIYVAAIPRPAGSPGQDLGWIDADPLVRVHPDGKFVLDNDLWLRAEGEIFPEEVCKHLRDHPRRSVTRATHGAQPQAAWETTPTTVLIGQRDNMLSEADRRWAEERLNDVRVIDTDHFIIFRYPDLVAQLVLDAVERT